jgi:hypothetical protein
MLAASLSSGTKKIHSWWPLPLSQPATSLRSLANIPSLTGRLIKNMISLFDVDPEQTAMTSQNADSFGLAYPKASPRWTLRECAPSERRAWSWLPGHCLRFWAILW